MNQPQEQIEDIRKACIAVNPSITELTFGNLLSVKGRGDYRNTMLFIDHSVAGNLICTPCVKGAGTTTVKPENAEIIGRDIRLSDVLFTLGKMMPSMMLAHHHTATHDLVNKKITILLSWWNFERDRLQDQSPETIAFIYELLAKEI